MITNRFKMVLFVSLAIINLTQGSGAVVSLLMKNRASFDGNLPLIRACYEEIENASPIQCVSQCLIVSDVCYGVLFNKESEACKLIKCNPADLFSFGQFGTGSWNLFLKEKGYCKTGWLKHEEHCYFFNETGDTWMNSKRMCEDNAGSLASISSSQENSWIVNTFLPTGDSGLCSTEWWKCCTYWIGATDLALEGTFIWTSDNSTLGFVNWNPGEPDNFRNQDCVSICRNGQWVDRHCDTSYPYICIAPAL